MGESFDELFKQFLAKAEQMSPGITTQTRKPEPPERVEAREWLASNARRVNPIACNHFKSREDSTQFVEGLYAAGAVRVWADIIAYHDAEEWGGPYTDTIVVELPADAGPRARIVDLCNAHCMADSGTGEPFIDTGQPSLSLWWD